MTNGDREGMISNPAFVGEFTVSQPTEKFTHFIEPIHCPLFLGKTNAETLRHSSVPRNTARWSAYDSRQRSRNRKATLRFLRRIRRPQRVASANMFFTLGLRHTLALWQRAIPLVQFS